MGELCLGSASLASAFAAAALIVACSSDDKSLGGTNSASGQVDGRSLNVQDAVITSYPRAASPWGGTELAPKLHIALSSAGALCVHHEEAEGFIRHKNETWLALSVHSPGKPLETGKYPINRAPRREDGRYASAQFNVVDAACASTSSKNATGGSVTLTSLSDSDASGTYSLTFEGGGALEGSFSRVFCPDVPDRNAEGCK
ncbi:hypothetical protein [Pendulispora albinea]|uniref:Lipoprotein n=1 Tax=Pendulispora albinea TaxID=2741071 RepID=A0ABZ2LW88_9BACT